MKMIRSGCFKRFVISLISMFLIMTPCLSYGMMSAAAAAASSAHEGDVGDDRHMKMLSRGMRALNMATTSTSDTQDSSELYLARAGAAPFVQYACSLKLSSGFFLTLDKEENKTNTRKVFELSENDNCKSHLIACGVSRCTKRTISSSITTNLVADLITGIPTWRQPLVVDWTSNQSRLQEPEFYQRKSDVGGRHSEEQFIADINALWTKDYTSVLKLLLPSSMFIGGEDVYMTGLQLFGSFDMCDSCAGFLQKFRKDHLEGQQSIAEAVENLLGGKGKKFKGSSTERFVVIYHAHVPYNDAEYKAEGDCAESVALTWNTRRRNWQGGQAIQRNTIDAPDSSMFLYNHIHIISKEKEQDKTMRAKALLNRQRRSFSSEKVGVNQDGTLPYNSLVHFLSRGIAIKGPCQELDFQSIPLSKDAIKMLAQSNLQQLKRLYLGHTEMEDLSAEELSKASFPQLVELYLDRNLIGDNGACDLANAFPSLKVLYLSDNKIGQQGIVALAQAQFAQQLDKLYLSSNEIGPNGAGTLCAFQQLRRLSLSYNNLGDEGVIALSKYAFPKLLHLTLSSNEIGPNGASALCAFQQLRRLKLSGNKLGDKGARALAEGGFLNMVSLELSDNVIGDEGARALAKGGFLNMVSLELSDNVIGDEGAKALAQGNLEKLEELNLAGNTIGNEGAMSFMLGRLKSLTKLYLFSNKEIEENLIRILRKIYNPFVPLKSRDLGTCSYRESLEHF